VEVKSGFRCVKCDSPLTEMKAVETGNIFKLGKKYCEAFNMKITGPDGKQQIATMGCYGIGTTRLVGTIAEASHDENGIIWPLSVAPYHVHLLTIGNDDDVINKADEVYKEMMDSNIEVLFDERNESPGVKLKDADLIGIPLRIVISKRTLEKDSVEWKLRIDDKSENVKVKELIKKVSKFVSK